MGVTYKTSGVDIDKANTFVKGIQGRMANTMNKFVLKRKGSFGALFALETKKYREPVLVSSTDGVGTKLLLAKLANKHDTVGIDLVAMNVNDVLCTGAQPLFFLDYIACGKIDLKLLNAVIKGIAEGCRQSGCSLIGGETAEMPDLYKKDDYDLAGFTVGVVEKSKIIDGSGIKAGDVVIGLASSGIHSNGYSLVRKVFSLAEQKRLANVLLTPTRIYVREVLALLKKFKIKGMAHITGGAFYEKLTKVLPEGLCFEIYHGSWTIPTIFQTMQKKGKIKEEEMFRTFNMGIGMALVVAAKDSTGVRKFLAQQGLKSYEIGRVIPAKSGKIKFV